MITLPAVAVRVAFASAPLAASPTWTTLPAADVMSFSTRRGRFHELDRMEAGTAFLTLKNGHGNYWPDNGGSAYAPNVKLAKRVNIQVTSNSWMTPTSATGTNWTNPSYCCDGNEATYAVYVKMGAGSSDYLTGLLKCYPLALCWYDSIKVLTKGQITTPGETVTMAAEGANVDTGTWESLGNVDVTGSSPAWFTLPFTAKRLAMVRLQFSSDDVSGWLAHVYEVNIQTCLFDLYTGFIDAYQPDWLDAGGIGPIMQLRCSDAIKALSALHLNNAGYAQQLSGARVGEVLDDLAWPAGARVLDTGKSYMQATGAIVNVNAMDHLFQVAESELGVIFHRPDGSIEFQDRHARYFPPYPTSQAIFGDDTGEQAYQVLEPSLDDQYLYNDVRITRAGGVEQADHDDTSIAAYGQRSLVRTGLLMANDNDAWGMVSYLLYRFKAPLMRSRAIGLLPQHDPTNLWPLALGFDLSTRITVRLNQASLDQDYHIEGISHDVDAHAGTWRTRWELSNALVDSNWWMWDISSWDGSDKWAA